MKSSARVYAVVCPSRQCQNLPRSELGLKKKRSNQEMDGTTKTRLWRKDITAKKSRALLYRFRVYDSVGIFDVGCTSAVCVVDFLLAFCYGHHGITVDNTGSPPPPHASKVSRCYRDMNVVSTRYKTRLAKRDCEVFNSSFSLPMCMVMCAYARVVV